MNGSRGAGAAASHSAAPRVSMRYDHLGFPIPPEFDAPRSQHGRDAAGAAVRRRATAPGRGKRLVVLALLAAVIGSAVVAPAVLPVARGLVIRWSVERAFGREARGQAAAAIGDVGRALAWSGDDAHLAAELLCWRSQLRLESRDAAGAVADADRAVELAPTSMRPRQVRALAHVVLARGDAALADAEATVELAGRDDPDALNHRAYIRALVGRDLDAALADIDAALASGEESPELLDTRGFVLHLLGRHQEAIDQLNLAIAGAESRRRGVAALGQQGDGAGAARQLRVLEQGLAVMHHHRGLACRAAGLERQAEQDLAIAEQKGYDPSRGVM